MINENSIMKESLYNNNTTRTRELPPHAYHPNPSLRVNRRPYIAFPD
jgi:hypothetical protein